MYGSLAMLGGYRKGVDPPILGTPWFLPGHGFKFTWRTILPDVLLWIGVQPVSSTEATQEHGVPRELAPYPRASFLPASSASAT